MLLTVSDPPQLRAVVFSQTLTKQEVKWGKYANSVPFKISSLMAESPLACARPWAQPRHHTGLSGLEVLLSEDPLPFCQVSHTFWDWGPEGAGLSVLRDSASTLPSTQRTQ